MSNLVNIPAQKDKQYTYDSFYAEYWKILHQRFFGRLKDYHIAEDLAQETMMRALTYWKKFEPGKEASFISFIASSVYVDHLRREAGRNNVTDFIDDVLELDSAVIPTYNFLDSLDRIYEQELIDQKLQEVLGDDLFYLFEEVYYKGRTVKELSLELGIKVNTLYWKMSQVKELAAEVYKRGAEED